MLKDKFDNKLYFSMNNMTFVTPSTPHIYTNKGKKFKY